MSALLATKAISEKQKVRDKGEDFPHLISLI